MPAASKHLYTALWSYRSLVLGIVSREFRMKYRESLLGGLWAVASPLTMIVIYTVVFSQILNPTLPGHDDTPFAFSIYLCAGVITWSLFAETLARLTSVFLDNANIIKKAAFPKVVLPVSVVLSALTNFAIIFVLYIAFLAFIGHWPGWTLLAFLPVLALQTLFTISLGILLGTLNVFFRDVGPLVGVVLQLWFWLTPIVYTLGVLPEFAQAAAIYNPMQALMAAYQDIFLARQMPAPETLAPLAMASLILTLISGRFFLARVGELVDEL